MYFLSDEVRVKYSFVVLYHKTMEKCTTNALYFCRFLKQNGGTVNIKYFLRY